MSQLEPKINDFIERLPGALRVIGRALRDWLGEFFLMLVFNVICILCWATIVLGPPAVAGMYYAVNRTAHAQAIHLRDMYVGARQYFWKAWLLMGLNLLAALVFYADMVFFQQYEAGWAVVIQTFVAMTGLLWLATQFYALPFLMVQKEPRVFLALRNGLFTLLTSLFYTLVLIAFIGVILYLVLLRVPPLLLIMPSLIALIGTHAVLDRVAYFRSQQAEAIEKDTE